MNVTNRIEENGARADKLAERILFLEGAAQLPGDSTAEGG